MKGSIQMNFNPVVINDVQTFIATAQVSDQSVAQAIKIFDTLIPHEGKTATGINKKAKDSLDITLVPNGSTYIEMEVRQIVEAYRIYFRLDEHVPPLGMTEHFNIQKYPLKGAFHKIHADKGYSGQNTFRELVFMTFLNDVHTGGETEFMFYNLKFKPKKGLTLIWPAGWTHIHRGLPSPTTEKIICTGWFSPLLQHAQ